MEQYPSTHYPDRSLCPECGHDLDLPPPTTILARKAVEMTTLTPAMRRARERRAEEIQALTSAREEIDRLWRTQEWESPIELMYAVVESTGISLETVNLAYHKFEKSRKFKDSMR